MWRNSCPTRPRRGEKRPHPPPSVQRPGPDRGGKLFAPQPRPRQQSGKHPGSNTAKRQCVQTRCRVIAGPSRSAGIRTTHAHISPGIPKRTSGECGWQGCRTSTIPSHQPDVTRTRCCPGLPIPFGRMQASKHQGGSAYGAESGASCLAFSTIRSMAAWSANISPVWTSISIAPTSPARPRSGRAMDRGTRHTMRSPVTTSVGSPVLMPVPTLESTSPPTFWRATNGVTFSVADTWTLISRRASGMGGSTFFNSRPTDSFIFDPMIFSLNLELSIHGNTYPVNPFAFTFRKVQSKEVPQCPRTRRRPARWRS